MRAAVQDLSRPVLRAVAMAAVVLLLDVRASAQGERDGVVYEEGGGKDKVLWCIRCSVAVISGKGRRSISTLQSCYSVYTVYMYVFSYLL